MAADSAYGDQDGFRGELAQAGLPFVVALKPRHGTWAYGLDAHTPADAAPALAWGGPEGSGDWTPVTRTFRGAGLVGPRWTTRLVIATADLGTLLGWADFQVRSDLAIRRHQVLVNCAFSFCWAAWFAHPAPRGPAAPRPEPGRGLGGPPAGPPPF